MNYKYDINNYRINRDKDHHVVGGKEYKAVDGAIAIFCTKDGDSDPLTLAEKSVTLFGQPVADTDTTRVWKNIAGDITLTVDKDKTFAVDEAVSPVGLDGYTCTVYKVFAAGDKFTELDTQGLGKKAFVEELAAEEVESPWEFGSLGEKSAQLVGTNAKAQAEGAVAEGKDTQATGTMSHAEGNGSIATGSASHAEGHDTSTIGVDSHAEGQETSTTVKGVAAHAEGFNTIADGKYAHVEGQNTQASGQAAHAEGLGGSRTQDGITYTQQASGAESHSEGMQCAATGTASHAEGALTRATKGYTHAEGQQTIASNTASHAEGKLTEASGTCSHAEGKQTVASAGCAHAEGYDNKATGEASHAEGGHGKLDHETTYFGTTASGFNCHSEGGGTTASGDTSHAEGLRTVSSNIGSHAEGVGTTASDWGAHAEGGYYYDGTIVRGTVASGKYSHAEGVYTIASGEGSHSEGDAYEWDDNTYTTIEASGKAAHAEGRGTLASGEGSHAEGTAYKAIDGTVYRTTASGEGAHAEGIGTVASGKGSHAGGFMAKASGDYSTANGVEPTDFALDQWGWINEDFGTNITGPEAKGIGGHVEGCGYSEGDHSTVRDNGIELGTGLAYNDVAQNAFVHAANAKYNIVRGEWSEMYGEGHEFNVLISGEISGSGNKYNIVDGNVSGENNTNNTAVTGCFVGGENNTRNFIAAGGGIMGGSNNTKNTLFGVIEGNNNQNCLVLDHCQGNYNTGCIIAGEIGDYNTKSAVFGGAVVGSGTGTGIQNTLNYAFAEGYSKASANTAHAEGGIFEVYPDMRMRAYKTEASGLASHAEGAVTVASGEGAHAEGGYVHFDNGTSKPRTSTAEGNASHAEGYNTYAKGRGAHAEGLYTRALNIGEHACGIGNVTNDDTIFTVGIGVYAADDKDVVADANMQYILEGQRMNAIQVHYSTGDQYVYGIGNFQGKSFAIIPDPEHIGATITVNLGDTIKNADGTDYINPLTNKPEHYIKPVQEVIEIQNARIKHLEDLIEHLTEIIEP